MSIVVKTAYFSYMIYLLIAMVNFKNDENYDYEYEDPHNQTTNFNQMGISIYNSI